MKSAMSLFVFVICSQFLHAQGRIGINTLTPQAIFHVKDSSVLFSTGALPVSPGNPPVSGSGIRFMWYAPKAAFRCGEAGGAGWDKDSIGNYSFAVGNLTKAKGINSFAAGFNANALNAYSFAAGFNANAVGDYSVAIGRQVTASDIGSTALGYGGNASGLASFTANYFNTADGFYSTALGFSTQTNGQMSMSTGYDTEAEGIVSFVGGYRSKSLGSYSVAFGFQTHSLPFASLAIGRYNNVSHGSSTAWVDTDPVFIVGNGDDEDTRRNAFTVLKNGKTAINIDSAISGLTIKGYDGSENNHLTLIDNNTVEIGKIFYTGDFFFKNTRVGGDFFFRNDANTNVLSLFSTGNMTLLGTLTQNSDARLKRDFAPITSPLAKVARLNGHHYYWSDKSRDEGLQTGFIAQEIEAIMPELVTTASDGTKSVNYIGIIPYLAEAIKELKKENEELRKLLNELLNKNK